MAHVKKSTRGSCGNLLDHYERRLKLNGEHRKYGNQDIDLSQTHLNYNLAPEREMGQREFIEQRYSEVKCLKRKDVNVMCSWVVTAPRDLKQEELRHFFEESYRFLNNRYAWGSERNVISAYVHMDETTPHMHYAFVPVVTDRKKGYEKVSAFEAVARHDLQTFHRDLERHMENVFGREVGILNETTKDGNKSIDELKRGTAQAEIEKLQAKKHQIAVDASNLQNTAIKVQDDINDLGEKKEALEGQIEAVKGYIANQYLVERARANTKEVGFGRNKSTLFKGVSVESVKMILNSATVGNEAAGRTKKAEAKAKELESKFNALEEKAKKTDKLEKEVEGLRQDLDYRKRTEPDLFSLRLKIGELQQENEKLKAQPDKTLEKVNEILGKVTAAAVNEFIKEWEADKLRTEKKKKMSGPSL